MGLLLILLLFAVFDPYLVTAFDANVTQVTTTSVTIEWVGNFTNVTVRYDTTENIMRTIQTADRKIKIGGLNSSETYTFQIVPFNSEKQITHTVTLAKCPENWMGLENACYFASDNNKKGWLEASKACSALPTAHLADPRSEEENLFLAEVVATHKAMHWIGINDRESEGNFTYTDSSSVEWRNVTSSSDVNNCILVDMVSLEWEAFDCAMSRDYICQYQIPASPDDLQVRSYSTSTNARWTTPPSVLGSTFNRYEFSLTSPIEDAQPPVLQTSYSFATSKYFYGLQPGYLYFLTIASVHIIDDKAVGVGGIYPATPFVTKPYSPQNFQVSMMGPTFAVLTWEPPRDGGIFDTYEVTYQAVFPESNDTSVTALNSSDFTYSGVIVVDKDEAGFTLDNLEPHLTYAVQLTCVSNHVTENGNQSATSYERTLVTETLVSPPRDVHVVGSDETSFRLTWTKAIGKVDGYAITVISKTLKNLTHSHTTNLTHFDVTGLISGHTYEVGIDSIRGHETSEIITVQQTTRPTPVLPNQIFTSLPENTSVEIVLLRTSPNDGGIFDGFNLTFRATEHPETLYWRIPVENSDVSSATDIVTGLTPGRTYRLTVFTTSENVTSFPVRADTIIRTKPASPTPLRYTLRTERDIMLEWDAVPGDIDGYLVTCTGVERACQPEFTKVKSDVRELAYEGLTPGAEYNFTLSVERGLIKSRKSSLGVRTKPNQPAESGLNYPEPRNVTSFRLTWANPSDVFDAYRVLYTPRTNGINVTSYATAGDVIIPSGSDAADDLVTTTLSELTPGLTYDVNVTTLSSDVSSTPLDFVRATLPEAVEELEADDIGETWSLLSWQPGNGGFATFQVSLHDVSDFISVEIESVNVTTAFYNVTSMQPSSLYLVTLMTFAADDVSASRSVFIQTRPLRPRDVEVRDVEETSFRVTWSRPPSRHDDFALQLFRLDYKNDDSYDVVTSGDVISTTMAGWNFDDLIPGAAYRVAIETTFNRTRSYPVMVDTFLYPVAVPPISVTMVTATAINITWERPRGVIGGYQVQWEPTYGEVSVTGEEARLSELIPGVTYQIDVFTLSANSPLRSRTSAQLPVATNESPPSEPEHLSLSSLEAATMQASWDEPQHPNGQILYYTLQFRQFFPHPSEEFGEVNVTAPLTDHVISDVEHGATYYVKVAAVNSAGRGPFTDLERVKVQESLSGPVSNLEASALSSSSISVSWEYPRSPNGEIIRYQLTVTDPDYDVISEVNFIPKQNVNPFKCILDNASPRAISSLLYMHASTSNVIQPPRHADSDAVITSPASGMGSGASQSDVSKELQQLSEVQNLSTVAVDVTVTSHGSGDVVHPQETVDVSEEEVESVDVPDEAGRNLRDDRVRRSVDEEANQGTFELLCPVHYQIVNLEPYTNYNVTVRVWNAVGEGQPSSVGVTTRQEPPEGPPTAIQVLSRRTRGLTLTWMRPDKPNGIPSYTVMLCSQDANDTYTTNETNLNVDGLQPFTMYGITIYASTVEGSGPVSDFHYFATAQGEPEEVKDFSMEAEGPRAMTFAWTPPSVPHGIVRRYVIALLNTTNGEIVETTIDAPTEDIARFYDENSVLTSPSLDTTLLGNLITTRSLAPVSHSDRQLRPYNTYTAIVRAETDAGSGVTVNATFRTAQDRPESPPVRLSYANLTSTSVNITWRPPVVPNGVVTEYSVLITEVSGRRNHYVTEEYAVVENLKKYRPYNVYVSAHTSVGEGPSSPQFLIHTDEDIPDDPPTNVTYRNISSSAAIHLSWLPPSIPNGIIRSYTVYYTNSTGTYTAVSNRTDCYLHQLQTYGQYNVSISSNTSKGESLVRSKPLGVRTMEGQPATPPFNLSYVNVTSRSVMMTWMPPDVPNGIIQFYNVMLSPLIEENGENLSFVTKDDRPQKLIDSLLPYSVYRASVRANTKYGDGDKESDIMNIYTMQDVPESAPVDLSYENDTSSSIRIHWQPPHVPNGIISYYMLRYYPLGEHSAVLASPLNGSASSEIVVDLEKYTPYNFTLTAGTVIGEGPASFIQVHTDEDEPSSPPYDVIYHQLNSTAITLEWKPPVKTNGIITGYDIRYQGVQDGVSRLVTSRATTVTLTNLRKSAMYNVVVVPYTKVGNGSQTSQIETFETLEDDPEDPPREVVAEPMTSTSVRVAWRPPLTPNGRIQFYTVYYTQLGGDTATIDVFNAEETLLENLRKYTHYDVMVTASTALGDGGQNSSIVHIRTLEDAPGQPTNLTCDVIDEQSILVTWADPLERNGILTGFVLNASRAAYSVAAENLSVNQHQFTVEELRPYTGYTVVVSGATSAGVGYPAVCSVRTDESVPSSPMEVAIFDEKPSQLTIKWQEPASPNGIILGYNVSCQNSGLEYANADSTEFKISNSSLEATVSSLPKFSSFSVRISAYTSKGSGPWSQTVQGSTLAGVPDSPVVNLTAHPYNSTSILVSWSPHQPLTGPTLFHLSTSRIVDGVSEVVDTKQRVELDEAVLTGLLPYTTYTVQVSPFVRGIDGYGPPSSALTTTLQDLPASPVDNLRYSELTSTSAILIWNPPLQPNGIITRYTVDVQGVGQLTSVGNRTEIVVEGLAKFQNYTAIVTSYTNIGAGPTTSIEFQTAQDVPDDAPSNILVRQSARKARIYWEPPLVPNGVITSYEVLYSSEYGDVISSVIVEEPQCVLLSLRPFTLYNISVRASTIAGAGPLSDQVQFTTDEAVPTVPTNLLCSVVNESAIKLSWNEPDQPNGIITSYTVKHQTSNQQQPAVTVTIGPSTMKSLTTMLHPYTEYDIEISASTEIGPGPFANCTLRTSEGFPSLPVGVRVLEFTDTSIEITWRGPLRPNGILNNYMLIYWPTDACAVNNGTPMSEGCSINTGLVTSYQLSSLRKYTDYSVTLAAENGRGVGHATSPMTQRTDVGAPDEPPRNVHAVALTSTSVQVTWSEPLFFAGITEYRVTVTNSNTTTESENLGPNVRDHVMSGLDEFTSYDVTVSAITSEGNISSEAVTVVTHEDVPSDFPQDVKVSTVLNNSSAVKVLFSAPIDPNGRITQYTIEHRLKDSQDVTEIIVPSASLGQLLTSKEIHSWPVVGLLGGRSYTFRVRASTSVGPGPWSLWTTDLTVLPISAAPVPDQLPGQATVTSDPTGRPLVTSPSTSFAVKSPCVFSDVNGPLASISVIVAQDGSDLEKEPTDWYEASTLDPSPPYQVIFSTNPAEDCGDAVGVVLRPPQGNTRRRRAAGDSPTGSFVIGDDETCQDVNKPFCNGPLKTNTEYRVKYRAETTSGAITDTPYSEKLRTVPSFLEAHQTLIIGVAAAVGAFIIILVTSVLIFKRRSRSKSDSSDPDFVVSVTGKSPRKAVPLEGSFEECKGPITESSAHSNMAFVLEPSRDDKVSEVAAARPVTKADFAAHITRMSLHKNKGFSGEFDDIRGLPVAGTTMAAEKQFNRAKNRHAKLVPFDHSRVKLEAIPAIEGSDYINASFIPGPQSSEQFVVTQMPLEHTRKDFWRLMWETGATTIVMLCSNLEEGKKRNGDYWPKKQTEYYGNLAVQLTHEDAQLDWAIRQFSITMRDKVRHLTQFQLVTWPVHEQSDNAQTVLRFVQTVRANRKAKSTPIVVMCASGSGRCGVFVCMDRMLENLSNSSQVDVFGTVATLRRYRPYMVQTLTEYILIHRCIWEAINQKVIGEEQFQRPPTGDGLEETVF